MVITPAQIDEWRAMPRETPRLEFKEAQSNFDSEKLHRYCVAIANEGGGHLVFGVADEAPRSVVGTSIFPDTQATAEKILQVVGFRVDVEAVIHPEGRVVVCIIPPRPRGTAYSLRGAYYMRSGEQLVPMTEDQLRKIFAEGEPNWLEEHAVTGVEPARIVELLDTQGLFDLFRLPYPTQQDGVIDKLLQERLIEERDGEFSILRLGAILFAKRLADFPDLSRKAPRVVVYAGTSKLSTRLDQTGVGGYAIRFQDLVRFVMQQLSRMEVIENALRRDAEFVPEVVVRELVANALIHQDFRMSGTSVMIEVFADRIEFSNPGEPIVPVERFIDGYQSRNERMADLMRRMGICEEKSSGIDRVVQSAEVFQLPAPDFRSGFQRTEVVLSGPKSFEEMDRSARVRACYQHCVLKFVNRERMTNQSLRERFKLSASKSSSISQVIGWTLEEGLIRADEAVGGSKKFARYLPRWA